MPAAAGRKIGGCSMSTHGLGIVGFGGIAFIHYNSFAAVPGLKTVGVYDIDPARGEVAKGEGLISFDSFDELLASPEIDIVLVATPNNFHKDYAIRALSAGKHVIVEKPAAMDSKELAEMMGASEKYGRALTVHQNRRRDTDYLAVKNAISDGCIGKPFLIESRVMGSRGVPCGWRCYKVAGGGMILDWGVHLIDQIMRMVDEPVKSVYAHMFSLTTPEVDDYFKLMLRFESGLSAHIEVGTKNYIKLPRWYALGEGGSLEISDWDSDCRVVRAKDVHIDWEEDIVYTSAGPTKTMAPRPKETLEEIIIERPVSDYSLFYANFLKHIDGEAPLEVKPEEALRVLKVIEAAFESNRSGDAVRVCI